MTHSNPNAIIIANDLLTSMRSIDKLISNVKATTNYTLPEVEALKKLEADLDKFYGKIESHFMKDPEAHREAFKMTFDFPSIFKRPATLELILTYQYMIVESLEKSRVYILLTDPDHMDYRDKFIKANRGKVGTYVKY